MSDSWTRYTLGEIAETNSGAVDGPFGSNLPASCYKESGIPVIRGSNLSIGMDRFKEDTFVYVSKDIFNKLSRSECLPNDIIFTKKGTLGQTGIIPSDSIHKYYLLSSNQMRLRVDNSKADPNFVYYSVSSQQSVTKIRQDSEYTGVPKINLDYLKKFPIQLPPLSEQKAIAHILGSLDDKIELNRQMNETLEAIAQALFKSWFVDFDPVIDNAIAAGNEIPDALKAKAEKRRKLGCDRKPLPENIHKLLPSRFEYNDNLGWIPEGWKVQNIHNILDSISKTFPLKKVNEVVFLNTGDILNGQFLHQDLSSAQGLPGQAKKSIQKDDILYSEIRPKK